MSLQVRVGSLSLRVPVSSLSGAVSGCLAAIVAVSQWLAERVTIAAGSMHRNITPRRLVLPTDDEPEEILASSETDNVKVFVRTRPINEREVELGGC